MHPWQAWIRQNKKDKKKSHARLAFGPQDTNKSKRPYIKQKIISDFTKEKIFLKSDKLRNPDPSKSEDNPNCRHKVRNKTKYGRKYPRKHKISSRWRQKGKIYYKNINYEWIFRSFFGSRRFFQFTYMYIISLTYKVWVIQDDSIIDW